MSFEFRKANLRDAQHTQQRANDCGKGLGRSSLVFATVDE